MTVRRPMPAEEAENLAGAILDRAIERARVTNAEVALAIGYAESGEKHVREMRAGSKAFTLRHFALATVSLPRLARAIAAELTASMDADDAAPPAVRATQEAALACSEMVRVGLSAVMDGVIDTGERQLLRVQSSRTRKALDTIDAALARDEARVS